MENIPEALENVHAEAWERLDQELPQDSQKAEFIEWAGANLRCLDLLYRDYAASIFEKTELPFSDENIADLIWSMDDVQEEYPYSSFRAACALATRCKEDSRIAPNLVAIKSKLESFVDDEDDDVSSLAKSYLEQLAH